MSAKSEADKRVQVYPWTARQRRQAYGGLRKVRKQGHRRTWRAQRKEDSR